MSIELTEDDWVSHRATIESLYLIENRKLQGAGGVMEEMMRKHGFKAKKAQFERHFKQWGSKKYKKKEIWEATARHITKRKRDEKETEVWIGYERIHAKKLKKELARYSYEVEFSYGFQAPAPKTPEGLYICTPPTWQGNTALLYDLPWFQFLGTIESNVSTYPDLAAAALSMANKSDTNSAQSKPQNLETGGYISVMSDVVISALSIRATTASTSTLSNTVRCIHHGLRAMIPEDIDTEPNAIHKDTSGLIKMNENVQHLSLAVFLLSNNMLDTEEVVVMTGIFLDGFNIQLLKSLLSLQIPTVEALAEKFLLAATKSGNQIIMQACLEVGADPNSRLSGWNALQYVARIGNIELVQVLLNAGADVNALPASFNGRTALQTAAENGNIELVQVLLNAGADVNALPARGDGRTALQAAAENSNIELVQVLLNAGADVNALPARHDRRTALQAAAENGNIELVQVLLNAGADVNAPAADDYEGRTALQAVAENGNIELVQILLDAGADVNAPPADWSGRTALQAAAENGNIKLVQVLLNAGADFNAPPGDWSGRTALQAVVRSGNVELAQVLLDAGADVNAPAADDYKGRTALQAAAENGNIELIQILLDAGADVNAPPADWSGRTALQAAVGSGNVELAQVLLNAGANVNAPAARTAGATSLQVAALNGYVRVATILLNANADVNATGALFEGRTALEGAAEHGRIDMVQLLLNADIDLWTNGDVQYKRTLQLASTNGHNAVKRLIEAHYKSRCTGN